MATSQTPTSNLGGDFEETVLRWAKHLGRDKHRRAVFGLIYGRTSKPRSKKQIAEALGMAGGAQVIQNALDHLAKHHLIVKIENDGHVADGSRLVYAKEPSVRANRALVERYADNPAAAKKVATKRRPAIDATLSLVKPSTRPARARARRQAPGWRQAKLKIALLVTNPSRTASLQSALEGRDIEEEIRAANRGDQIDCKVFLAPTLDTLLDMLNRYRPDVVHFSGHGGDRSLLFDNERAGGDGGTVLDFDMVARVIAATSATPKLMVLAACDTVDGADRFLTEVPAVVAMAAAVDDAAACLFSRRFYRSLCSGATITQSVEQARLALESKGIADAKLPTLVARDETSGARTLI